MKALIYLYIIIGGYNSQPSVVRVSYPTAEACQDALAKSQHDTSKGAESENVLVMFCGPEDFQQLYGTTFWKRSTGTR